MNGLPVRTRAQMAGRLCSSHAPACVAEFDRLLASPVLSAADRRVIYYEALEGLAIIHSRQDAERYAREAVRLFPQEAYFHWQWANALLFDQPEEALREAYVVEELGFEPAATYELFGKIYRQTGRWELAIAAFERSLKSEGSNAWTQYWLGEAYWKAGREEDAIREWQAALLIAPGFQEAQQALESAGVRP
jgi:tetratricopeptide (TPR) repeat protein